MSNLLNDNQGVIALVVAIAQIFATIVALYLASSFHDIRKAKKIKLFQFNEKLNKEIYPRILNLYLDYQVSSRQDRIDGNYVSIQQYAASNQYNLLLNKSNRIVITKYNLDNYSTDKEFFDFLKENNIISGFGELLYTSKDSTITKIEHVLTPSIQSWNKVEEDYKNSPEYKKSQKWNRDIYNALWREIPDEIMSEEEIEADISKP